MPSNQFSSSILLIYVPVPRHKSERSCICVLCVSILSISKKILLDFVPTVWYILFFILLV
jgi:hypothetical protein